MLNVFACPLKRDRFKRKGLSPNQMTHDRFPHKSCLMVKRTPIFDQDLKQLKVVFVSMYAKGG